jgi:hypothetical protein
MSMNVLADAEPIATIEEFKAALLATRDWHGISQAQLQMLQAQCRAPECAISSSQMAERLKLKTFAAARQQYCAFARAIADRCERRSTAMDHAAGAGCRAPRNEVGLNWLPDQGSSLGLRISNP